MPAPQVAFSAAGLPIAYSGGQRPAGNSYQRPAGNSYQQAAAANPTTTALPSRPAAAQRPIGSYYKAQQRKVARCSNSQSYNS